MAKSQYENVNNNILIVKNMVCPRCVNAITQLFKELQIGVSEVQLGKVILQSGITSVQKEELAASLRKKGFELLDNRESKIVNEIKAIIIEHVHFQKPTDKNYSDILTERLHFDYPYLSRLFSSVEGKTIERYIMSQKIEKVKELLIYDELTVAQIAYELNYSSPAHLSGQFRKVTGMSPTSFKKLNQQFRIPIDKL